ncbi:M14 family zinc carboxypeptidase [Seonamhaeicola aphaedonensis]|uniref:Putative secreted protein (Por secretion system target) n=1 Tax=Seonamhaeicola aphaedonensis TaxID=1461338 RepID=A0A3D9HES3_9FLAO|nr:M14 family zinc carboxypeptidase [Seonamhaeicola aphaedonensis]RED47979.1 putative secreted protein (Por secretion system target) [Seonamhaeicola aphaedonensis]
MKRNLTLIFSILCLGIVYAQQPNYKRIIINSPTHDVIHTLSDLGMDLSCGALINSQGLQLELSEYELKNLKNKGITYNVLINDLTKFYADRATKNLPTAIKELESQKTSLNAKAGFGKSSVSNILFDNIGQYNGCDEINWPTPTNFKLGSMGGCFTVSEALAELDLMRSLYPNIISVKTDASPTQQTTLEGRTTYYVRISDNPDIDEPNEPETLYTGMTHSRELSSLMNLMYYMWYILENYGSDPAITSLVNNQELYFIPIVNSDGLAYNEAIAPNGGGLQRKNRNIYGGSCGTTSEGVDLNRNFGYYWGNGGSSTNVCSEIYRGPSFFSENESQIVRDFFLDHDFKLVLNHHSFKNAMLHGYAGVDPATLDLAGVDRREDEFAKYNHDMTHFNRYAYGPSTQISALNSGNMNDWMMGPAVAGSTGGPGAGKDTMAWTPENGGGSEAGSTGSGFWPDPLLIDDIARRAMRANFLAAYFSGKYAKIIDLTSSNVTSLNGNFNFGIEYLGQTDSDFTLTLTPISSNIISLTNPPAQSGMITLEQRNVSVPFTLDGSIQPNDAIEFKVALSNDDGIIYEANVIKYYTPTILFEDNEETNGIANWTASGGSWGTTNDAFSGTVAITDSPSGAYNNNESKTLQLNNAISTNGLIQTVIQYNAKWDLERSFDYVQIEASTNGSTWTPLCGTYTKPGAPNENNTYSGKSSTNNNFQPDGEQLYDGDTQDKWVMEEIVISASENSSFFNQANVFLRFSFNTDSTNNQDSYTTTFDGFVFDDFRIITNSTNIPQTITFDSISDKFTTDAPFQVNATASSGLPVSFSIVSGPASVSGNTITLNGTTGFVTVRASQSGNTTYNPATDVEQSFEVLPAPCLQPPTGLAASNIAPSSATISWDTVQNATFNYQYRESGTSTWITQNTTSNSVVLSNLTPSTQYEVQVNSVCPDTLESSYSTPITFTTDSINYCVSTSGSNSSEYIGRVQLNTIDNSSGATLYSDFTNISTIVEKGSQYTVTITPEWTGRSRREGYGVWIDYNYDGDFNDSGEQILSQSPTKSSQISTSFTVPQSAAETSFRMRVSMKYNGTPTACESFSDGEVEDYTITIESTGPDVTPPSAPTGLAANNTTDSTTDISWNASTDNVGVTGYDIYQDSNFLINVSGTSYQVNGLSASTPYSFYVIAKDAAGNSSAQSNTANITTQAPPDTEAPSAPANLVASNTTFNSTDLSWTAPTDNVGVTGYDVYQDGSFIGNTASTNYAVTSLSSSTSYSFYVIARDAAGNSSVQSNSVNVTTDEFIDTNPPTIPTELAASNITDNSIDLSWNASTDNVGVTGYDIYQDSTFLINVSGTNYQVTSLSESTNYTFYVIARDAAGNSSELSNSISPTTLAAPTCNDGIQNGDESGIDCGGSVCPTCPPSDTILHEGYFETGFDGWTEGGKDVFYYSGSFSYEGVSSIKLRDSGISSSISSPLFNLSQFDQVEFNFYLYANGMESGDGVLLQYNDGSGWITVVNWINGSDFNDNIFFNAVFNLDSSQYNLVNNGQFRIQCNANAKNDNVYIDQVIITGRVNNSTGKTSISKSDLSDSTKPVDDFIIYPNPVEGILRVKFKNESIYSYRIINTIGKIVKHGESITKDIIVNDLESGLYFINVYNEKESLSKKFIKR